uniref:Peptidase M1 leukotriene A4 hydrolase/aminopeptidase C-terminal domain-containing protein n=1 Tax=Euplotes crassus TaxID=5936 RepID=A0A7S3K7S2_EUPCR|mmetsp:Transcript_13956/g.13940  ORF Transcript_13956/g.13940 Transcript_13956/m.13940 type:complete len:435 (+) Transcript_13956:631-1935(+)
MSRYSTFEMNIPVQSYLLAIASGNLVERRIGNRTFVISEPEEIEKVANEFSELEDFLSEAERLTIPYEWGVYKLLILPPSFPFGGMENPLLTFASPAIVPGDKSSVDVAIHEIAHSWFGNLVTNNNWTNFWLNEGFTTFLERKTVRNIFGEDFMKVTAKLENQTVYFEILDYGLENGFTSLHPVFNGTHPDEALSDIPYEKGFQFLIYLESLIGEDYMLEFLRSYLKNFAYTSIDVTNFISFFSEYVHQKFTTTDAEEILSKIDFDAWIYAPGLPPITVDFETKEYNDAIELAQSFLDAKANVTSALQIFKSFSVNLKGLFISHLIDNQEIVDDCMAQYIYDTLQLGDEINGEVVFRWLIVAIRSGQLRAPFESADEFVGSIGRMKYVIPVYQAMLDSNAAIAKAIFNKHEDFYHPIAIKAIQDIFSEDVLISA